MKKFLTLMSLVSLVGSMYAASALDSMYVSPEMVASWHDLKAQKFGLAAKEFDAMADSIPNRAERKKYKRVAREFSELARDIKRLPVPRTGVYKTTKYEPLWKKIHARKVQLKARQLEDYANQLEAYVSSRRWQRPHRYYTGEERIVVGPYVREVTTY